MRICAAFERQPQLINKYLQYDHKNPWRVSNNIKWKPPHSHKYTAKPNSNAYTCEPTARLHITLRPQNQHNHLPHCDCNTWIWPAIWSNCATIWNSPSTELQFCLQHRANRESAPAIVYMRRGICVPRFQPLLNPSTASNYCHRMLSVEASETHKYEYSRAWHIR